MPVVGGEDRSAGQAAAMHSGRIHSAWYICNRDGESGAPPVLKPETSLSPVTGAPDFPDYYKGFIYWLTESFGLRKKFFTFRNPRSAWMILGVWEKPDTITNILFY